jgi:site-specific recombinase XerD
MARSPRSSQIENRTNRLKLKPRRKPYYGPVAPGIRLGYRRNKGAGTWTVKAADGHGGHWIKAFATADDYEDANGGNVLTYWQALDKARAVARGSNDEAVAGDRPITVGEALDNYAAELEGRGGDGQNVSRVRHHLSPTLAAMAVGLLTARELRHWRDGMLKRGLKPASADRSARALKAALSLAAREDHRITNTAAWRDGLARLPDGETARNDILPDDAVRKLVAAAYGLSPAFGLWIETHAVTGARTSQIERLEVRDLQADAAAPRLMMPSSRKGKRKRIDRKPVPIAPALAKALRKAAADRGPHQPLLVPPGGETLLRRWFKRARGAAGLDATTTPYSLRHSSIVRALLAGVPTRVVAAGHDTSTVMIERNYSAYIADHADALTRRALLDVNAPAPDRRIVPLGRK